MERIADRVRSVVWLDAHKPKAGESVFDLIGPERAERMTAMAAADGQGWFIPTSDASWWGLTDPGQIAWVNSKTTPQPIKTYTDIIGPTDRARARCRAWSSASRPGYPSSTSRDSVPGRRPTPVFTTVRSTPAMSR